jgi:hypothetical protein
MLGSLEWDEYSGEAEILTPALSPVREPEQVNALLPVR